MPAILKTVLYFLFNLVFGKILNKNKEMEDRIREDKDLADAIKRGDGKTIERIRKKRFHYKLFIVMLIVSLFCGCSYFKNIRNDIPLTEGDIPYKLPPAVYVDVNGSNHNERLPRWSISEADLLRDTQSIKPIIQEEKPKQKYMEYSIVGLLSILIAVIISKKIVK